MTSSRPVLLASRTAIKKYSKSPTKTPMAVPGTMYRSANSTGKAKTWFIKLFNWEYWPFNLVYVPVYFYWVWLIIKSRSVFFFNTSNPLISNGGFLMESKKEIYDLIPQQYYPATLLFKKGSTIDNVIAGIKIKGIDFPLIAKPGKMEVCTGRQRPKSVGNRSCCQQNLPIR